MGTKTFDTRIRLKYDSNDNWENNNPVLLEGEIALTTINVAEPGTVNNIPAVMMKCGDGVHTYKQLDFISGKAADVYSWALAPTKPTYDASEISGLSDYISGEIQDSNTTYKIEQDASNSHILKLYAKDVGKDWTLQTTITTADTIYDDTEVKSDISALENLVGNISVATQIANAINTLNIDNYATKSEAQAFADAKDAAIKAAKDAADAVQDQVNILIGSDNNKSIRTIANEELAAQLIPENANESLDTLTEIAAWIQAHPNDASAMNEAISALQNQLSGISSGEGTVKKYIDDAITALNIGDYAKASDLINLAARVSVLEGKSHEHSNKELLDTYTQTEADLSDAVDKRHNHNNKAILDDITSEKVAAWDKVTDKIDSSDISEIGKTGNINDAIQSTGDILIFNCGTSYTVI